MTAAVDVNDDAAVLAALERHFATAGAGAGRAISRLIEAAAGATGSTPAAFAGSIARSAVSLRPGIDHELDELAGFVGATVITTVGRFVEAGLLEAPDELALAPETGAAPSGPYSTGGQPPRTPPGGRARGGI